MLIKHSSTFIILSYLLIFRVYIEIYVEQVLVNQSGKLSKRLVRFFCGKVSFISLFPTSDFSVVHCNTFFHILFSSLAILQVDCLFLTVQKHFDTVDLNLFLLIFTLIFIILFSFYLFILQLVSYFGHWFYENFSFFFSLFGLCQGFIKKKQPLYF